ncbi:DNA polymerase IV [Cellulomonas sp. RIT-PI-Y]|uniref:DNA polymerase IV n=1 Tax=Cellulomonas sp. RIT-PI-Y TaxID=3035297 RepID=UPI003211D0B9
MSRGPRAEGVRRDWGREEEGASILHVDMDAFFASVELARRPHLRGRPVIVGGSERSVVLAATYEARAFGVHSAMPMAVAKRMCPQAIVIPPDHRAYYDVSHSVMAVLHDITSLVEQVSVDEAFLDVAGARRRLGPPTRIAAQIRERVRDQHGITCSVGIAANKFVAKLASGHAKPDGVLLIPRTATVDFLRALPVGALWGVGERTAANLERWGIRTVAELADSDVRTVQQAVGKTAGAHLYDLAWGRDPRPVSPSRDEKSVGAEETFDVDIHDLRQVESKLLDLADRCAGRLRAQQLMARTVAIKIRTSDFRTLNRSRTLPQPTDVAREMYLAARELLAGVDLAGLPVRLVGVRAEGLLAVEQVVQQPTLEESVTGQAEAQRQAELVMDQVRERFGRAAIGSGTRTVGRHAGGGAVAARHVSSKSADPSGRERPDIAQDSDQRRGPGPGGRGQNEQGVDGPGPGGRGRDEQGVDGPGRDEPRSDRRLPDGPVGSGQSRSASARNGGRPDRAAGERGSAGGERGTGGPVGDRTGSDRGLAPERLARDLPKRYRLNSGGGPRRDEA